MFNIKIEPNPFVYGMCKGMMLDDFQSLPVVTPKIESTAVGVVPGIILQKAVGV